ncbi:hypothetical protein CDL15_Pgr007398 [Punica granatum]|uniref:Gnk2-homologous domain-containing protein n=1 Tax=Punica granatum TaxID=22663 RepID=A0A218X9H3_PUNGR|nr:hypothetical protein CDL15_Pgr007398 [Punica granatum]PKI60940.1 hypothetical protein CRG98_018669 [Punica granatum]
MDSPVRAAAIVIGLLCTIDSARYSVGVPDLTVLSKICNGQEFPYESFRVALDIVLDRLISNTPDYGFNYYDWSDSPSIYGHAACNGKLSKDDCQLCLTIAREQLSVHCPENPYGAQVHLQDCRMRYEFYEFDD